MKINELRPAKGAVKSGKRKGRGHSSGKGVYSTRGLKGQKARSGYSKALYYEGGQTPLIRQIPKRGFTNIFKKKYSVINLEAINALTELEITPEILLDKGLVKKGYMVKILGNGNLKSGKTIKAHRFSRSAEEKIEGAKGKVIKL